MTERPLRQSTVLYRESERSSEEAREDDYEKLRGRMQELGLNEEEYGFYLDLRKYGSTDMQDSDLDLSAA